jgi:hypothetical protein
MQWQVEILVIGRRLHNEWSCRVHCEFRAVVAVERGQFGESYMGRESACMLYVSDQKDVPNKKKKLRGP